VAPAGRSLRPLAKASPIASSSEELQRPHARIRAVGEQRRDAAVLLLVVALGYLGLGVLVTWPLASDPGRLITPNADSYLNAWAMAWVVHQGLIDPAHLYDANTYHPLPLALAYTETLLPQALQALPVRLLGGSALLAYNLVLLATFPLAGLGAYLLARDLGASRVGALLAGLAFGFGAFRNEHLVHVQTLSHAWLPFALLALRRALAAPRVGWLAVLAGFSALQALSSGYYAVMAALGLGVAFVHQARHRPLRHALRVAAALAGAALLCVLLLLPQILVQQGHQLKRGREECARWSARWTSYLDPGAHGALPQQRWLVERFPTGEPLYPGLAVLVLAAAGIPRLRRSREARFAALLLATGLLFSLGPDIRLGPWTLTGPYELIRQAPGASGLRTPVRLAVLGLLGLGLLAALAWTALAARRRWAPWLGAGLLLLTAAEAWPTGLSRAIRPAPEPPAALRVLDGAPRGAVLELPWNDWEEAALYMYWSTAHWQPLVDGFGAFQPPGFRMVGLIGRRWPSPHAAHQLRARGVRYVVVHLERVTPAQRGRILENELPDGVRLLAATESERVWEIAPLGPGAALN